MDDTLILTIIITIAVVVIVCPIAAVILKSINKNAAEKHKGASKLNAIKIGMSEAELYSEFGQPKEVTEFDSTAKIVTYQDKQYKMLFTRTTVTEAKVKIKNGVVIDVELSSDAWINI